MITFLRFGKNMGRLGNQVMQLMTLTAFSKQYNCELQLPRWNYSDYFENPPKQFDVDPAIDLTVNEDHFHYTPLLWAQYKDDFRSRTVNLNGWLQSYKYWEHQKEDVYKALKFKDSFIEATKAKMDQKIFEKPIIAISVRQGDDYANNPNYELIPIKFYILALLEHFPDFRENYNLLLFSDEPNYCKLHFSCLSNVWYADQFTDIEQLCIMSTQCRHFIIANSTFSWCGAKLGEREDSIVVCPNFLFKGAMAKNNDFRDFYCEHWKKLDHKIKRIDLKNTTFTIPVHYDSRDRKENVDLSIKYLRENFDTNITVGEQAGPDFSYLKDIVDYRHFTGMADFHRTKMLNDMAGDAKTPVVVNWDGDVIVPPMQIVEAVRAIVEDKQEMVYPYDGRFARVARHTFYRLLDERVDVGCLKTLMFNGMRPEDAKSVGGAIFWDSLAFLRCGLENENMVSYGPEDAERYDRAMKLGLRVHRIHGVLYHVDHILSVNSSVKHPKYPDNVTELEKIRSLTKLQLEAYIDTWDWARKYTPSYYESIFEESVKSRDAIFRILESKGILKEGMRIVDVGCGLGQWGFEAKEHFGVEYRGIDFGVPEHKLRIPVDHYLDHDLRKSLLPLSRFDLALCMEVAEHLPKESADQLIDTLCELSDTILFSAAIPGQGGIDHINEQWQSWWSTQFVARGYYPNDYRELFLRNENIAIWYQQNSIIYTRGTTILSANDRHHLQQRDFVHPQMYMNLMKHYRILK